MELTQALHKIAADMGLDGDQLVAYAAEDEIGGYHPNPVLCKWHPGSMWEVEGKVMYALVRAIRPANVLEIGVYFGCSTTHILAAMDKNKKGKLISFDFDGLRGNGPPEELRKRWTFLQENSNDWIPKNLPDAELVLEDGFHEYAFVYPTLKTVLDYMKPQYLVSHDAEHFAVGADVRHAWDDLLKPYNSILIAPSDCGLAYKRLA